MSTACGPILTGEPAKAQSALASLWISPALDQPRSVPADVYLRPMSKTTKKTTGPRATRAPHGAPPKASVSAASTGAGPRKAAAVKPGKATKPNTSQTAAKPPKSGGSADSRNSNKPAGKPAKAAPWLPDTFVAQGTHKPTMRRPTAQAGAGQAAAVHDPHAAREASRYADPIPSREAILKLLAEADGPMLAESLCERLGLDTPERRDALGKRLADANDGREEGCKRSLDLGLHVGTGFSMNRTPF